MSWAVEPGGPVGFGGDFEFFAPAVEVEGDFGFEVLVFYGENGVVGEVGGGAGVGVEVGLLGHAGGGGVLFDVEEGGAVLGGIGDGFGVEMVAPEVALGVFESIHVAGV